MPPTTWKRVLRSSSALVSGDRLWVPAAIASGLLVATPALAGSLGASVAPNTLPTGGQVVSGSASIARSPGQLDVNQATQKAIVNWQGFSIGSQAAVDFHQPNASAIALNRVKGSDPSEIAGQLNANGQVWIVNPNGVMFSKTAEVNTAGILASTADITNTNFNAGVYKFDVPGKPGASVVNAGHVTVAQAGMAAFVAPSVANSGVIDARLGKVTLASGSTYTLDMYGDGLVKFAISPETAAQLEGARVTNTGQIKANGGTVVLSVGQAENIVDDSINDGGTITAKTVGTHRGSVTIDGNGGTTTVSGTITVSGLRPGETGGIAKVLGGQVALASTAKIDASGAAGGGTVDIGGDFHGAGPDADAANTVVWDGAQIDADATNSGNGGQVAVWSNGYTNFDGSISAKGGSQGGNGGYVETSSGDNLAVGGAARVDASAPRGMSGQWLLDPQNLTVDSAAASSIDTALGGNTSVTLETTATTASGTGTVTSGAGDITVAAAMSWAPTATTTLTLNAYNSINIDAPITIGGTNGALVLQTNNQQGGANTAGSLNFLGQGSIQYTGTGGALTIGNAGVSNAYTLLYTMSDVQGMSSTGFYALAAPIDASGSGTLSAPPVASFSGTFNGLGNTISDLAISDGIHSDVGLFGTIGTGATVANLGLVGASVTGAVFASVGGLAGASQGTIMNVYVTGAVGGGGGSNGGLVGYNNGGTIADSYAAVTISGVTGADSGGLVGLNTGLIEDVYATGAVSGGSGGGTFNGGLVGSNSGTIEYAYATGAVSGGANANIGGLFGINSGTITNDYYDTDTTTAAGAGTAETTAGLESSGVLSALNTSPLGTVWGNVNNQTTPYLLNLTSNPQTVFVAGAITTPYQLLFTMGQLQNMSSTGFYALAAPIDASGSGTLGAPPVTSFSGTFNGLRNTISNLTISDNASGAYVGLFGQIGKGGIVANLGLVGGSVSGGVLSNVGELAGYNNGGTIENAYATGAVNGGASATVGGLVGLNAGTIQDAYATGAVNGGANSIIGGLVGSNSGTTEDAYATGVASAVGGAAAGGLVGSNNGTIEEAYATGAASAGGGAVGGLVGNNSGPVTNGYWDQSGGAGTQESTTNLEGGVVLSDLNSSSLGTVWGNVNNQTTPYLLNLTSNPQTVFVAGATTTPYQLLFTMGQVQNINNGLTGDYALANALNAATDPTTPASWSPIGESTAFTGTFNGLGNTISNLTINDSTDTSVGLFGQVGSGGTVANLGLLGGSVTDNASSIAYVGTLAGYNNGTIQNVFTTSAVTGGSNADVGGLVGWNDSSGVIENVYATGAVTGSGTSNVGGLVGNNNNVIKYAYATGVISGVNVGGLVGHNAGTITSGYYDADTTGQPLNSQSDGSVGEHTADLQSGLPSGFSSSIWGVIPGSSYPYLTAFYPTTPQVISGIAYSDAGSTPLAAGSVAGLVGGVSIGSVSTGHNGYYYFLEPAGTISGTGSAVLTYTSTGISFEEKATASLSGFDIYGTYLWERAISTTLSALSTDLTAAEGSAAVPTGIANQRIDFSASGFDIDQALSLTGALTIYGAGQLTESNGPLITVGGTSSFTGSTIVLSAASNALTGAVTLLASGNASLTNSVNTTLSGSTSVSGRLTVDTGAKTLTLNGFTAGSLDLSGVTGAITLDSGTYTVSPLFDISDSGGLNLNGDSTFNENLFVGSTTPVTLLANSTLTSTGVFEFDKSIDGDFALTLKTNSGVNMEATIGATTPLASFTAEGETGGIGGTFHVDGGLVKTAGPQTYDDPVLLDSSTNPTFTSTGTGASGNITFASTVVGSGLDDNALTVVSDGTIAFKGTVGVGTNNELSSLTTEGNSSASAGTTDINTTAITTSGGQDYKNAVTLSASPTLSATAGNVTFEQTMDNASSLAPEGLTVEVGSGKLVTFDGVVGGTNGALLSLLSEGFGTATNGTTDIETTAITTTGTQTYSNAVSLSASPTLTTTNALVTLGPVTGASYGLYISSGTGGLTLNGLTISGGLWTTTGPVTLNAGTYDISGGVGPASYYSKGGVTNLNGAIIFDNPTKLGASDSAVKLLADTTLTGSTASDNITFAGTVDGGHNLTVVADGTTAFQGVVGAGAALTSVTTEGSTTLATGTTDIN
ncbi:MAG: filamentous hemagglutinin N-terminal domain-containing protein, partial [Stellaceae bacterium]